MEIRYKRFALVPTEREKICTHDHVPYIGPAPYPGKSPRRCSMCNMEFENDQDLEKARNEAVRERLKDPEREKHQTQKPKEN